MGIRIYGASDDLIEVEGDVLGEFGLPADDKVVLATSNGVAVQVEYTASGIWRITRLAGDVEVSQASEMDDEGTDVATVPGVVRWVVAGEQFAAAKPMAVTRA